MRVLWVSLVKFPPLCEYLGEETPSHCGWVYASAQALREKMPDVQLGVIVGESRKDVVHYQVEGIDYYLAPTKGLGRITSAMVNNSKDIIADFRPDLIHLHGTEYAMALAVAKANGKQIPIVANIQGLASGYIPYADGGLSLSSKLLNVTPLDFYRNTFMLTAKRRMRKRAKLEIAVIKQLTDIVGRTRWDKAHSLAINPHLRYHFMNETLRPIFYDGAMWSLDRCDRHTIFVSNSGEALKGAHNVVKALPYILKQYPDAKVRFVGRDVLSNAPKNMLHFTGYNLYLRRLIKKLHVEQHVHFLGSLSGEQMKENILRANVYVLPSAIENSPNSLGEAQLLGVPAIASYCGGTPDMVKDGETGFLYRYEEVEELAHLIEGVFEGSSIDLQQISKDKIAAAEERHNATLNAEKLTSIYKDISLCK